MTLTQNPVRSNQFIPRNNSWPFHILRTTYPETLISRHSINADKVFLNLRHLTLMRPFFYPPFQVPGDAFVIYCSGMRMDGKDKQRDLPKQAALSLVEMFTYFSSGLNWIFLYCLRFFCKNRNLFPAYLFLTPSWQAFPLSV